MPITIRDEKGKVPKKSPNMWTFCDKGCYCDLKHGRCWIDAEDWPKVKDYYWYSHEREDRVYVFQPKGNQLLHKHILIVEKGFDIDHKDRNGLENRKFNLRVCTRSENNCNAKCRKDNRLGVKCIRKVKNSFHVRITKGYIVFQGCFKSLDEAIKWRDEKTVELHGEFARRG